MREILFKAKRTDNGEWAEGYYCKRKTGYYDNIGFHEEYKDCIIVSFLDGGITWVEVDPETLCQHTGLTQKNIWENDIVKTNHGYIGIIRFGQYDITHYGFYIEWINGDEALRIDLLYWLPKIKSIGNIFDNPELLGGDSANGNQDLIFVKKC